MQKAFNTLCFLDAPPDPRMRAFLHYAHCRLSHALNRWLDALMPSRRLRNAGRHWRGHAAARALDQWQLYAEARRMRLRRRRGGGQMQVVAAAPPVREDGKGIEQVFRGWKRRSREQLLAQWLQEVEFKETYWHNRVARATGTVRTRVARTTKNTSLRSSTESSARSTEDSLSLHAPSTPGDDDDDKDEDTTPVARAASLETPSIKLPLPTTTFTLGRPLRRPLFGMGNENPATIVGALFLSFQGANASTASPLRASHDLGRKRAQLATDRMRSNWPQTLRR